LREVRLLADTGADDIARTTPEVGVRREAGYSMSCGERGDLRIVYTFAGVGRVRALVTVSNSLCRVRTLLLVVGNALVEFLSGSIMVHVEGCKMTNLSAFCAFIERSLLFSQVYFLVKFTF
jgi:hypothetical protein